MSSQLNDLAPLRELKTVLDPDDAIALAQALEGIEWLVHDRRSLDIATRTCIAVEELNCRWLAERGVCALVRDGSEPGELASGHESKERRPDLELSFHRILKFGYFPLTDREWGVQIYVVSGLVCGLPCNLASYVHHQMCIVIDYGMIDRMNKTLWGLYDGYRRQDRTAADQARAGGMSEFALGENTLLAISVLRQYQSEQDFLRDYLMRVQIEETRHAVDWLRAEPKLGPYAGDLESCHRFLRSLVRRGGRLFAELFGDLERLDGPLVCEERHDVRVLRAAIAELSGQLTACALCYNPCIVLREWWARMAVLSRADQARPDVDFLVPHTMAAIMGISLLAAEAAIPVPDRLSRLELALPPATDVDRAQFFRGLADACQSVLRLPGMRVRLAVKQVYQREFQPGIIDEAPFLHRIQDDGCLKLKSQEDQPPAQAENGTGQ